LQNNFFSSVSLDLFKEKNQKILKIKNSAKNLSKIFFQEFSHQKRFFMSFTTHQVRMKEKYRTKLDKV